MRPREVLIVIHDKMDHAKIAKICYACKIKATYGLSKLLVAITGLQNFPHIGSLQNMRCACQI
jgi:hypothetical protein